MRKVCCWYLKNGKNAREFRGKASHAASLHEIEQLSTPSKSNKLMIEIIELHAIFKGGVQGVGFRWTIVDYAEKNGLTGTVRNLPSGEVEVFAQGSREALETFLEAIHEDPGSARIESVKSLYKPLSTSYSGFHIIY